MRTVFRVFALAAVGITLHTRAEADDPTLAIPDGILRITQRGAATVLVLTIRKRAARAVLPEEDGISAGSLQSSQVIGTLPGQLLILRSEYASRPNGGSHQCGAGTETVLRVIALQPVPRQTFHQRVESCWQTVEGGEIGWDGSTRTLTIERTTFDPDVRHVRTVYRIEPNGVATSLRVDQLP